MFHINHSFAAKLNFYILSLLIALFAIGFVVFQQISARYLEKKTYEKISAQAAKINDRVSHLMRTIEKIPDNMSWLIPTYVTTPDSIYSITREVVRTNEEIFGCAIAFEPYYFPTKGAHFAPYSYTQGDKVVTTQIKSDYDYYRKNWYKIAKEENVSRWTRPYHELSSFHIITSTYSVPLRDSKGKVIGIFSVDLSLNWLTELIDSIKPYPDSYIIIINREGRYILHQQDSLPLGKNLDIFETAHTMPDSSIIGIARRIARGETGKATFFDRNDKSYIFYSPIKGTEWCIATICPYKHIYEGLKRLDCILIVIFILLLISIFLICTLSIRKITSPLKNFTLTAASIADGNFNTPLPAINTQDEMQELHSAFSCMQKKLTKYVENLAKTTAAKEKIESELRIAHDIQMSMLPKNFHPFPEHVPVELYAVLHPARQVGGDLYDFFIVDHYLYFAIGDVSGKGIPASLMMASAISSLRSLSSGSYSPAQIANLLNKSITEHNDADIFITFFIGMLDLHNGLLKYCNAGHTHPIMTHPDRTVSFFNIQPDLPLGILKGHVYQEYTYQFNNGSGILLYTDGITDAENEAKEFYTADRLLETVRQNHELHPQEFIEKILIDVQNHIQHHEPSDDLSMLTIIYGPEWNIEKK